MIVTRGLGGRGSLVALGLGITLALVIVEPPPASPQYPSSGSSGSSGGHYANHGKIYKAATKLPSVAAKFTLPSVAAKELVWAVEAKGSAKVMLLTDTGVSEVGTYKVSGAANFKFVGVAANSELGTMLASGKHDLSDEEILSTILALLNL